MPALFTNLTRLATIATFLLAGCASGSDEEADTSRGASTVDVSVEDVTAGLRTELVGKHLVNRFALGFSQTGDVWSASILFTLPSSVQLAVPIADTYDPVVIFFNCKLIADPPSKPLIARTLPKESAHAIASLDLIEQTRLAFRYKLYFTDTTGETKGQRSNFIADCSVRRDSTRFVNEYLGGEIRTGY